MNSAIWASVGITTVCIIVTVTVRSSGIRLEHAFTSFGSARNLSAGERKQLFSQLIRQQSKAFALLWVAVAVGIVLSAALLARIVASPSMDIGMLGSATGVAGNLWIGRYSWKAYAITSQRLENF